MTFPPIRALGPADLVSFGTVSFLSMVLVTPGDPSKRFAPFTRAM